MSFRSRARFGLSLALAAAVLSLSALPAQTVKSDAGKADAAKKDKANDGEFRRISFRSSDGVELEGRFYPAGAGGAKDACVLMLHNFSHKTGGDSRSDEGWGRLAVALQKEGFPVLTFDFRGFGSSKSVDKALFWDGRKHPHNARLRGAAKMPETIDQKDFYPGYYLNLVNDVAAAKAYLDRRNDAHEVNDSNLIVIGAGEGATVGALWLASECRRQKDKNSAAGVVGIGRPDLDQPECKDVTCAVWLSISPTVGGQPIPVKNWLVEAGRDHKIPMGFIYGKDDSKSLNLAQAAVSAIKPTAGPKKFDANDRNDPRGYTAAKAIPDTKLVGSQLLQKSLGTEKLIVKTYLPAVMERPGREWKKRDSEKYAYVWSVPGAGARPVLAKKPGDEAPLPLPLGMFFPRQ